MEGITAACKSLVTCRMGSCSNPEENTAYQYRSGRNKSFRTHVHIKMCVCLGGGEHDIGFEFWTTLLQLEADCHIGSRQGSF
eukprot:2609444-Amphidinium_carterae.1